MRRFFVTLLGWLVLLVGLRVLVDHGQQDAQAQVQPVRLRTYELPVDGAVTFDIEPGTPGVKLVSWLIRPVQWTADPRLTATYCLRAELFDPEGGSLAEWEEWISTRQSLGQVEGAPLRPTAWLAEGDDQVCDDRLTQLHLPRKLRSGTKLQVRACHRPVDARLRFVAFAVDERSPATQARLRSAPDADELADELEAFTTRAWDELPAAWREHLVRRRWVRLAALGGVTPAPTQELLTTFERGSWWNAPASGVPVPPGGALAFNLEGDTELHAEWWTTDGQPAPATPTEVRVVDARGEARVRRVLAAQGLSGLGRGEGIRSVQVGLPVSVDGPRVLRAWTVGGGLDRAWGDPPRGLVDPETDRQPVGPDLRNLTLYRALPREQAEPLAFEATADERLWFRFVVPLSPELPGLLASDVATVPGPTVRLRALDAAGTELGDWTVELRVRPSIFERYTQLADPARAAASEPEERRFRAPEGTARVEVEASAPVDLLARVETGHAQVRSIAWAGYEEEPGQLAESRYQPLVRSRWSSRAPLDRGRLERDERAARVDLQVRLEERDERDAESRAPETGPWHGLVLGRGGRMDLERAPVELLVEPDTDGRAGPGARVALGRGVARVEVDATGRLAVEHILDPARLVRPLQLLVGEQVHALAAPSTTGVFTLHGLQPGRQQVTVLDADGRPARLGNGEALLARADGGSPLWGARRVRRLQPDVPLEHGPLPSGGQAVAVLVYGAGPTAVLDWSIEGVELDATGLLAEESDLVGSVVLRPSDHAGLLLSRGGQKLRRAQRVDIPLPAGLPPGGRLVLSVGGTASPVYLRALATWPPPPREADELRHWTIAVGPGGAP